MIDRIVSWIYVWRVWGPRCEVHNPNCVVCREWEKHDDRSRLIRELSTTSLEE